MDRNLRRGGLPLVIAKTCLGADGLTTNAAPPAEHEPHPGQY